MVDHELPWSTKNSFDHVLLNGTMVFDHDSLWSTMVDHDLSRLGLAVILELAFPDTKIRLLSYFFV